ncbi:cell division ATP-binding protein FtsE [Atopobacter phocae]|uniref:cell division ATP-binding protein FtsE n=1 Tax=Atopobacter phocae TaxID=136492 RepID=UPI00046F1BF6|nr:cell division ATP-binding protein FtsE [Atopobacter phocae]
MVEMMNVEKYYDNGLKALEHVAVQIDQGEFVYLVGSSGAGKSTLAKLLYREEEATNGHIEVGHFNVTKMHPRQIPMLRRFVGVVYQDFKLLPRLTIYENIAYAMEVIGKRPREIKRRVSEVLELVNLSSKAKMFPNEISGGEQQRVAIARAIVNTPGILIADEPTGNLDPETSMEIMNLLETINHQGTTVIMATHNNHIVNSRPHRVIQIENGMIVRDQERGAYAYDN